MNGNRNQSHQHDGATAFKYKSLNSIKKKKLISRWLLFFMLITTVLLIVICIIAYLIQ